MTQSSQKTPRTGAEMSVDCLKRPVFPLFLPPLAWLEVLAKMTEKLDPPVAVQRTIKERKLFLKLGKIFALLFSIARPTTIVRKHKEFASAVRRLPDGVFRARFRAMWISLPVLSDLLRHSRTCAPFWGGPSTRHIEGRALLADREQNPGQIGRAHV